MKKSDVAAGTTMRTFAALIGAATQNLMSFRREYGAAMGWFEDHLAAVIGGHHRPPRPGEGRSRRCAMLDRWEMLGLADGSLMVRLRYARRMGAQKKWRCHPAAARRTEL